uniref:Chemokine interleukin-8-like domain-containing protein n=1 Tax=Esox lucius TaxID=8010 RepID=A0AAY5KGJ7_ESOLU
MKLCLLLTLVATYSVVFTKGMQPIGRVYNRHCLCVQLESRVIPPDHLRSVEVRPRGPSCTATEVIAGLVTGERICLNPNTGWVKKLARFVIQKQSQKG